MTRDYYTLTPKETEKIQSYAIHHINQGLEEYRRIGTLIQLPVLLDHELWSGNVSHKRNGLTEIAMVREFRNWRTVRSAWSDVEARENFMEELMAETVKLSQEIAFTVEFFIRSAAQCREEYGEWRVFVPEMAAVNLFWKTDNITPNLQLKWVMNDPSGLEIDEPLLGWVSYKFQFTAF
jgi:hypothetical protein